MADLSESFDLDEAPLLPVYSGRKPGPHLAIPFHQFAAITVALPLLSFVFCVAWSILYDFKASTATHCQVDNYLPSISSAIGGFAPQKYVWMVSICLHFVPRLMSTRQYFRYLSAVIEPRCRRLVLWTWVFSLLENFFLLGLTLVSSSVNYVFHAFCFVSFILASLLYMACCCFLLMRHRSVPPSHVEARSLRLKLLAFAVYLLCFVAAGYFFWRHNAYCEAGVYSLFSLFEYGVVLFNMGFHYTAVLDFADKVLVLTRRGAYFS